MTSLLRILGVILGFAFCVFGSIILFGFYTSGGLSALYGFPFLFLGLYFLIYGATGKSSVVSLLRSSEANE